jgi:hypothetical protein
MAATAKRSSSPYRYIEEIKKKRNQYHEPSQDNTELRGGRKTAFGERSVSLLELT